MMNTQTLQTLIRHHRDQPHKPGFDDDGKERWRIAVDKLDEGVQPVAVEETTILSNKQWSDEGKRAKRTELATRVVRNFEWLGQMLQQADDAKRRLETILLAPLTEPPKGNEVVLFLQDQELRQTIGKREAHAAFLKAVELGDTTTTRALLSAPGPAWVSDDIRQRGEAAYAQRTNPDAWQKLQYVEFLRENLAALAAPVAQWLMGLGASAESVQKSVKAQN